jgi:predicted phage-related endonuclease
MKNKGKNTMNNLNLAIVRNIAYNQIKKINKNIKEVVEVDKELLNIIDINMKNAINKILHDYKVYQQTGVYKIK